MDLGDYKDYIYYTIWENLHEQINLPVTIMKQLYEKRIIQFVRFCPKQTFAYNFLDLVEEGKCNLVEKRWLNSIRWGEPKPKDSHFKYGDMGACDGAHIVKRDFNNIYRVIIQVKNDSEWLFEFDKDNPEHMKSFYKLFYNILYDNYIDILIKRRVEEINDKEIENLTRISQNILNNYETNRGD